MFTGIVSDIGRLAAREAGGRFRIACNYPAAGIVLGASIACDGCCLTVVAVAPAGVGAVFEIDASPETLRRTTLGDWQAGRAINLERALALGDELGGHMVAGHVDGVAEIASVTPEGNALLFDIAAPPPLARYIAPKGSVALDGTSLTVNTVADHRFTVAIIPHTASATTWGQMRAGSRLNLEVDLVARYVERLLATRDYAA